MKSKVQQNCLKAAQKAQQARLKAVQEQLEDKRFAGLVYRLKQVLDQTADSDNLTDKVLVTLDNMLFESYSSDLLEQSLFRDWLNLLMCRGEPMNALNRMHCDCAGR
jgi:hypothetical protein